LANLLKYYAHVLLIFYSALNGDVFYAQKM